VDWILQGFGHQYNCMIGYCRCKLTSVGYYRGVDISN
jgi:hypothetical protein